jgi:hypothetical protein
MADKIRVKKRMWGKVGGKAVSQFGDGPDISCKYFVSATSVLRFSQQRYKCITV